MWRQRRRAEGCTMGRPVGSRRRTAAAAQQIHVPHQRLRNLQVAEGDSRSGAGPTAGIAAGRFPRRNRAGRRAGSRSRFGLVAAPAPGRRGRSGSSPPGRPPAASALPLTLVNQTSRSVRSSQPLPIGAGPHPPARFPLSRVGGRGGSEGPRGAPVCLAARRPGSGRARLPSRVRWGRAARGQAT